jgi:hypothetical protein
MLISQHLHLVERTMSEQTGSDLPVSTEEPERDGVARERHDQSVLTFKRLANGWDSWTVYRDCNPSST